jgi:hypothetical protein
MFYVTPAPVGLTPEANPINIEDYLIETATAEKGLIPGTIYLFCRTKTGKLANKVVPLNQPQYKNLLREFNEGKPVHLQIVQTIINQ